MRRLLVRMWLLVGILLVLGACTFDSNERVRVAPLPTPTSASALNTDTEPPPLPASTGEWTELLPGMQWRSYDVSVSEVHVLRIDPNLLQVRVAYDPFSPGRVSEWMSAIKPLAVINGGYFDQQGRATALTIYDGVVYNASYEGFGGMLAVDTNGVLTLRSLREQPYDPGEPLAQALQSTPLLVQNGLAVAQPNDDGDEARRTVAALDKEGYLVLIVNGWPSWTLTDLSRWLVESDLQIDIALNLDGGKSSGMYLATPARSLKIDSLVRVPQVLIVENRQ